MRIPFWQRDEAHPTRAIDRIQHQRGVRRMIGLELDDACQFLTGSLIQIRGTGRYSRIRQVAEEKLELEDSARQLLSDLQQDQSRSETDLRFAASELASYQANCIASLVSHQRPGQADIIAVGVWDPGFWFDDFNGTPVFRNFSDATTLASRSSFTIIDQFAARDIADGGRGAPLFPICYWFCLADRHEKVAVENRLLILAKNETTMAYWLPASDGLDLELPELVCAELKSPTQSERVNELANLFSTVETHHVYCDEESESLAEGFSRKAGGIPYDAVQFDSLNATSVGLLASFLVDQLPASIPFLTGNPNPRILGAVTPGSLNNFRKFVLEMSKVTPSVMKLRDAI